MYFIEKIFNYFFNRIFLFKINLVFFILQVKVLYPYIHVFLIIYLERILLFLMPLTQNHPYLYSKIMLLKIQNQQMNFFFSQIWKFRHPKLRFVFFFHFHRVSLLQKRSWRKFGSERLCIFPRSLFSITSSRLPL